MDDDVQDIFDRAIDIGIRNQAVLQMAAAWCQNIGVTKGPLGTGMVEQMTGLPISGGSLRCDYAKAPTMFGMVLEQTAVEFYEQNCIGCPDRRPTEAAEHLGTWADAVITEREEQRRQQEEMLRQVVEARQRRHKERRLLLGAPDPTRQSILDLIDRIDVEAPDPEAERLLLSHAEMSPGDFPDELIEHLTNESIAIGNDALLESVIAIFDRQGRPATDRMLRVAFEAVGRGVAAAAAGRVIAVHAERFEVDDLSLDGIVLLAAGCEDDLGRPYEAGAEPAALIHFFDLDPECAAQLIDSKLGDEDVWVRATAAHAAGKLVGARPAAGPRLLPALLDAVRLPDKSSYLDDPFASAQAQNVVADILVIDPSVVAREIDTRMQTAELADARKLWSCFDKAVRGRLREPLPMEVGEAIFTRGMILLRQDLNPRLLREVSDTLELLSGGQEDSQEQWLPEAVALVLFWEERIEAFEAFKTTTEATAPQEQMILSLLESESNWTMLGTTLHAVKEVLKTCAARHPSSYVELLVASGWSDSGPSGIGRESLLDVVGSVVREQALLDRVEPLLSDSLQSLHPGERAAALRAFAEIGDHDIILPEELSDKVIRALMNDDKLIVRLAAIRALGRVEVPVDRKPDIINCLLGLAQAYGAKRLYSDDVEGALRRALQISQKELYEERAAGLVLEIIGALPSAESANLLDWLPLEYHAGWPAAVVRTLRPDPDPRYYGIRDYKRRHLLRRLAELPTERLVPFFEELERVGLERLSNDPTWAWAIADVLAYHQQHERAAALCDAVVATLLDTRENRPARRFARQIALGHHLDVAVAAGDVAARERLLEEWEELAQELED